MKTTEVTACPLDCFGVCSFNVTIESNDLCAIEANSQHPLTGNIICTKGKSHIDRRNHPDRILRPMMRTAEGWKVMAWSDAMAFIADKTQYALRKHGHQSIAHYCGGGAAGKLKGIMELFFDHLGGGTSFAGGLCWSAGIKAQTLDFGNVLSHSPDDLAHADSIVFWGKNPADTHFHLMPSIAKARKNGCQVILIDPIKTATSSFADCVIQPVPGSDWALAAALIKAALEKDHFSTPEIRHFVSEQNELLAALLSIDIATLLAHCGVTENELNILLNAYTQKSPCATFIGYGLQRHRWGGNTVRLIDLLVWLTHNIGIEGGGANYANKANGPLFDWSWAQPPFAPAPRLLRQGHFGHDLVNAAEPPVKVLFIAYGNPAVQTPDAESTVTAIADVDTVIVIDHFMTDTAQLADIVLPAAYFLEEEDIISSGMWNTSIHYAPKLVEPLGEARSEWEIFTELADMLNINSFPQLTGEQWLRKISAPMEAHGISFDTLKEKKWLPSPLAEAVPRKASADQGHIPSFNPLSAEDLNNMAASLNDAARENAYPMVTYHRRDSINSQHMKKVSEDLPVVRLHPSTAERESLVHGCFVVLHSGHHAIDAVVSVDESIRPNVLAVSEGGWRKDGYSLNDLTPRGETDIGGQALLNAAYIRIIKE